MPARFHLASPLLPDQQFLLPASAARHVQVLRLQPGDQIRLFDGGGEEWAARIVKVGRSDVEVRVGAALQPIPALPSEVTLAVGMPANERMDWLVEKATELGVAQLQPLMCERSVLRLQGERAQKKRAHWQAIAVAACEQSGRATVPVVAEIRTLPAWLAGLQTQRFEADEAQWRGVLSLREASPLRHALPAAHAMPRRLAFLNGPEGGLTEAEESLARGAGFVGVSLGQRVLRADTAPLAAMAWVSLMLESR